MLLAVLYHTFYLFHEDVLKRRLSRFFSLGWLLSLPWIRLCHLLDWLGHHALRRRDVACVMLLAKMRSLRANPLGVRIVGEIARDDEVTAIADGELLVARSAYVTADLEAASRRLPLSCLIVLTHDTGCWPTAATYYAALFDIIAFAVVRSWNRLFLITLQNHALRLLPHL